MASFTVTDTSNCRGGSAYSDKSYVIRVDTGNKNRRLNEDTTEALLIKQEGPCNLENIKIRTWLKAKTYTSVEDYIREIGKVVEAPSPWSFVKVLVGDTWMSGTRFYTNTQPSTDEQQEPNFEEAAAFDESRPPRQNACSVVPGDTNYYEDEDEDIEVPGEVILPAPAPAPATEMDRPVDRCFTDYPGMEKEYRVRFRPVDGRRIPGTWGGDGVIYCQGYYENRLTKHGYHGYTIRLHHQALHLYSVAEYAEIGLGMEISAADAWSRIEVKVDGRWMLGTVAAKQLFNIEVQEDQNGVLTEFQGISRQY
jgi:hypothetical protein